MISFLRGQIVSKQPPLVVIDVNGVGYDVHCPMSSFYHLPEPGENTTLLIHFIVREDSQTLYGFVSSRERELFRALIKVNGVGPKLALTILSGIEVDQFIACVRANDSSTLIRIPGIGKKTAARLLIDIRDNLNHWELPESTTSSSSANSDINDAISALMTLGYKETEARKIINKVATQAKDRESLIRLALKHMVKGVSV